MVGVLLAALAPSGEGYFAPGGSDGPGVAGSLLGAVVGFGVLLPLYLLRAMGAGDVKLMATSGAFLSPAGAAEAAILTLAIGGLISLVWSAWSGVLRQAVSNVRFMLVDALVRRAGGQSAAIEPVLVSAGKVPYAIAIAGGVAGHVALLRAGWSLF